MAYDETTYRRNTVYQGESDPSAYRAGTAAAGFRGHRRDPDPDEQFVDTTDEVGRHDARDLDDGRDRLGIHIGWEIILLLAVATIGYLLYRHDPDSLRRPALDTLLITGASIGALTLGAGLTLRAGVPNLAVGPIALGAALHFAENGDDGLLQAAVPALIIAAAGGLIVAVVVLVLHVPGWTATLAAAMGVIVYDQLRTAPVVIQPADYDPADQAFYLFGGFALLAVFGGALGTVMVIRRLVGRQRPAGDPAVRSGATAALPVIASLMLSSVFAVVAGVLMAAQSTAPIRPGTGLEWTGLAFGAALLAGTSAYGRRGGVFGTLLAVAGLTLFLDYAARRDFGIALFAIGACTVGAGLIVTRLVETYGRPLPVPAMTDWNAAASAGTAWTPDMPQPRGNPAEPAENRPLRWDEGPWGSGR